MTLIHFNNNIIDLTYKQIATMEVINWLTAKQTHGQQVTLFTDFPWRLHIGLISVAVDCIALNYWGKHKRKMVIRGTN